MEQHVETVAIPRYLLIPSKRSVSSIAAPSGGIFRVTDDSLSYVQLSFRVLRLTPDPQHSRDQLRRLPRHQLEYSNGPGD